MSKIVDSVTNAIQPIIDSFDMEIVEVEFKKWNGSDTLIVYIDKDGGIDLNDCEKVHHAIDPILDELDITHGKAYNLNVSSPGLDRPLKTPRDFEKALKKEDKLMEVSLFKPIDKLKKFEADLVSYDGDTVEVEYNKNIIKLNIKDIAVIRPAIKF